MRTLRPALAEKLRTARLALDRATCENIIALCKQYLALLAEYRSELYSLPDTLELNPRSKTSSRAEVNANRKAVRAAIEHTTREREWAEALILSFTAISGYGAVETLSRQKHRGRADWRLSASGASYSDAASSERMTIQEAVETASLLRREAHVARNASAAGAGRITPPDIPKPELELW
ncbi:MAG: hypothetical protein DMF64_03975 [Acidobacteria bacterium]|nr:MAG: hypothetical protein DMF64_03975 [Acidobacteriota bacterium]